MSKVCLTFPRENAEKAGGGYVVCDASTGAVHHNVSGFVSNLPPRPERSYGAFTSPSETTYSAHMYDYEKLIIIGDKGIPYTKEKVEGQIVRNKLSREEIKRVRDAVATLEPNSPQKKIAVIPGTSPKNI